MVVYDPPAHELVVYKHAQPAPLQAEEEDAKEDEEWNRTLPTAAFGSQTAAARFMRFGRSGGGGGNRGGLQPFNQPHMPHEIEELHTPVRLHVMHPPAQPPCSPSFNLVSLSLLRAFPLLFLCPSLCAACVIDHSGQPIQPVTMENMTVASA
jgi:hypothetical protein